MLLPISATPVYSAPDPLSAIGFIAIFIGLTLLTMRRPALGACGLILVQPFTFYQNLFITTLTLPKVVLIAVLIGLATRPGSFLPLAEIVAKRIVLAGVLVVAATALSVISAVHHGPVLRETLKAIEYVLIFIAVFCAFRTDPDRTAIRTSLLLVTIAVSLLALAQEVIGSTSTLLMYGHVTPRVTGPLEGPNQLAGFFDVALPLTLALAIEEGSSLAYTALFLAACADILTFSRAGIVVAFIGIIITSVVLHRNIRRPLAFAVLGAAAGAVVIWAFAAHLPLLSLFARAPEASDAGSIGNRSLLWRAALTLWRSHPFFGVGAGNFELEIPLTGLHGIRNHASSLYLQSLVEGGIPLFLATLWLTYTSIATFWKDRMRSAFIAAAFAGSITLGLHQIVDLLTFYPKVGGWWWLVLALGAAELSRLTGYSYVAHTQPSQQTRPARSTV